MIAFDAALAQRRGQLFATGKGIAPVLTQITMSNGQMFAIHFGSAHQMVYWCELGVIGGLSGQMGIKICHAGSLCRSIGFVIFLILINIFSNLSISKWIKYGCVSYLQSIKLKRAYSNMNEWA